MATHVYYNGVEIHNVSVRQFEQRVEYDPSRTDGMYHSFHFECEGVIYAGSNPTYAPTWTAKGSDNSLPSIVSWMLQPRRLFKVEVQDDLGSGSATTLFECWPLALAPSSTHRDVNNGPKPLHFKIIQVIGTQVLRVSFGIECATLECLRSTGGSMVPYILSNRWSFGEEMDENQYLTRVIAGSMRLSASVADLGTDYRALVVPRLESGFRREAVDFTVGKDGLTCEYRIRDRQVYQAAPWPATNMDVSHTEGIDSRALCPWTDIAVRLEGPPASLPSELVARAIQIIFQRSMAILSIYINPQNAANIIIDEASITQHIGRVNAIDAHMRITKTIAGGGAGLDGWLSLVMGPSAAIGKVLQQDQFLPLYDQTLSMEPSVYGWSPGSQDPRVAVNLTMQCYLQEPCFGSHVITGAIGSVNTPGTADSSTPSSQNTSGTPSSTTITMSHPTPTTLPSASTQFISSSAQASVYRFARMTNEYPVTKMRVQLPVARSTSNSSQSNQDASIVVQLGPPQAKRIIIYDAERVGAPVEVPMPLDTYTDGSLKATLLESMLEPQPPVLSADKQQWVYRCGMRLVYALNREPTAGETMKIGALPFANPGTDQLSFSPQSYQQRLL